MTIGSMFGDILSPSFYKACYRELSIYEAGNDREPARQAGLEPRKVFRLYVVCKRLSHRCDRIDHSG